MTAYLAPFFDTQFFDGGSVAAGYKLYTYDSGATTPKAVYTDQAGLIPHTNPILLDADGRVPGQLWLVAGEYTLALKTAADAPVETWSDVGAPGSEIESFRAELSNTSDAAKGTSMLGHRGRTLRATLDDYINVKCRGVVGDWNGATGTDDTTALAAAAALGVPLYFPPNCRPKITAGITFTAPIYMADGAYIHPTGSGYTAVTAYPAQRCGPWRVRVGDGNMAFNGNGVVFGNPALAGHTKMTVELLSAHKCSGKGVEINNIWESTVGKLEAYDCGSATEYAMAVKSNVGDSSNTTSIQSLVVGQSDTKALYVSLQHGHIGHIHCEQTIGAVDKYLWLDKCVGSTFGKIRAYNAGTAKAYVGSSGLCMQMLDVSSDLVFDHTGSLVGDNTQIDQLMCPGTVSENSPASALAAGLTISIANGRIGTLVTGYNGVSNPGAKWDVQNCTITAAQIGRNAVGSRSKSAARSVTFRKCAIGTLSERVTGECAFSLDDCEVAGTSGTFSGFVMARNSRLAGSLSMLGDNTSALNYQAHIDFDNFDIGTDFITTGNVVGEFKNSTISGNMVATNGGTSELSIAFTNTGCLGTSTASFGNPPSGWDRDNSTFWGRGKRIDNIRAAVGSAKGWVCTNASANTWVSEGNL